MAAQQRPAPPPDSPTPTRVPAGVPAAAPSPFACGRTRLNTPPPPTHTPRRQVDTTMGSFTLELYYKHAPRAVENFTKLADRGYYDGTVFHRIIRDCSKPGGWGGGWGRG